MQYRKGYKYQLAADEVFLTKIFAGKDIDTQFISLSKDGTLIVKSGYAWDGPSGPTLDRKTNMRGSLAHDALYQLVRQELLAKSWRPRCDDYMQQCCIEDGMWKSWARLYRRELKKFAAFAADPKNAKKVYQAP